MTVSEPLRGRLDALRASGAIAGWQDFGGRGGHSAGLSRHLPALIFPADEGGATTYYSEADLATAASVLERFGAVSLSGRR